MYQHSILLPNISLYEYTTFCLSTHQLMDIFVVFHFWWLWIMLFYNILLQAFGWIYIFISLGFIPRAEISGSYSNYMFTFWGTDRLFSKVTERFTFLLAMCESCSLSMLSPTLLLCEFFITVILVGTEWYLIVVLNCIFIMTKNVSEHLLTCLFVICISYLEKCLFVSLD